MKKVYGYYESIALANQADEFACANYWKQSWNNNGWECIMLNRSHASGSPLYNKLQQKLIAETRGMPSDLTVRFHWITSRFVRWCALHASGGGWMTDYDVVNKSFKPEIAENQEKDGTLCVNTKSPAYIFYATQDHCSNAIKKFIQEPLIVDGKIIEEANVLNVQKGLNSIEKSLRHAKSEKESSRAVVMKNFCDKFFK
jgi:hypothetical protein